MEHFAWKEEYSVGDDVLDNQHKELIRIMNVLYELLQNPTEAKELNVESVFDRLANYIAIHFAYEENRIQAAQYPLDKLIAHRAEHDALIKRVRGLQAEVCEGRTDSLKDLLPYLYGEWLINHICHHDMDYRAYLEGATESGSAAV
jgi:hemerythrin